MTHLLTILLSLLCLTCSAQVRTDGFAQGIRGTGFPAPPPYWYYDYQSGTNMLDVSGNSRTGLAVGAYRFLTNSSGNIWTRDEDTSGRNLYGYPPPNLSNGTYAAWFKSPHYYPYSVPFITYNALTQSVADCVEDNSGMTWRPKLNAAKYYATAWSPASTATNWVFMAFTWSFDGGVCLYTNGVMVASDTTASANTQSNLSTYALSIKLGWGGYSYQTDNAMYFTNALTSNQVNTLYLQQPSLESLFY